MAVWLNLRCYSIFFNLPYEDIFIRKVVITLQKISNFAILDNKI